MTFPSISTARVPINLKSQPTLAGSIKGNGFVDTLANRMAFSEIEMIFKDPEVRRLYHNNQSEIIHAQRRIMNTIYSRAEANPSLSNLWNGEVSKAKTQSVVIAVNKEITNQAFKQSRVGQASSGALGQAEARRWQTEIQNIYVGCMRETGSSVDSCRARYMEGAPKAMAKAVVSMTAQEEFNTKRTPGNSTDYKSLAVNRFEQCYRLGSFSAGFSGNGSKSLAENCARGSLSDTLSDLIENEVQLGAQSKGLSLDKAQIAALGVRKCTQQIMTGKLDDPEKESERTKAIARNCGFEAEKKAARIIAQEKILRHPELQGKSKELTAIRQGLLKEVDSAVNDCYSKAIDGNTSSARQCLESAATPIEKSAAISLAEHKIDSETADGLRANGIDGKLTKTEQDEIERIKEEYKMLFKACIDGASDEKSFNECTKGEKKSHYAAGAQRDVTGVIGRKTIKEKLNTNADLSKLKEHNQFLEELGQCLKQGKKTSAACQADYKSKTAGFIADAVVKHELGEAIGKKGLQRQSTEVARIRRAFEACVHSSNAAANESPDAQIDRCTVNARNSATQIVKAELQETLKSKGDSANAAAAKKKLSDLLVDSQSGGSRKAASTTDILAANAALSGNFGSANNPAQLSALADYAEYDPSAAKIQVAQMEKMLADGSVKGDSPQEKLYNAMDKTGAADQLVRAQIRDQILTALNNSKDSKEFPKSLLDRLTSKKNIDRIFTKKVINRIAIKQKLLAPHLAGNLKKGSPEYARVEAEIKKAVAKELAMSEHFGKVLAKHSIQKKIDESGYAFFTGTWQSHAGKPEAKNAEMWIQENIVYKKLSNQWAGLSKSKQMAFEGGAENRVKSAIFASSPRRAPASAGDFMNCQLTSSCTIR